MEARARPSLTFHVAKLCKVVRLPKKKGKKNAKKAKISMISNVLCVSMPENAYFCTLICKEF